ncbi:MAG: GFA family protein, partial [Pseudomonadota bacterium]
GQPDLDAVGRAGGCLCGAVRYRVASAPKWTALCHCESCRRAASAPVVAWMGFEVEQVSWQGERQFYKSSEIALRSFCPSCGSPMSFESTRWPGEVHLYGASLDAPDTFVPQLHCHRGEHLAWLRIDDTLPSFEATAEPTDGEHD